MYYAISQNVWWVGIIGLLLAVYLYHASKLTDDDMAKVPEQLRTLFPFLENTINVFSVPRNRFIAFLIVGFIGLVIFILIILALK